MIIKGIQLGLILLVAASPARAGVVAWVEKKLGMGTPPEDRKFCPEFDHRDRFPPVRSQAGHGYCWAFAGTALLEEELCRYIPALCKLHLSPLDASRCDWKLGKAKEGGFGSQVISCAMEKGGVCFEESAPYEHFGLDCTLSDFLSGTIKCGTESLKRAYRRWKDDPLQTVCADAEAGKKRKEHLDQLEKDVTAIVARIVPEIVSEGSQIHDALHDAADDADFLKKLLISSQCRATRVTFPKGKFKVTTKFFPPGAGAPPDLEDALAKAKAQDRSLSVDYCAGHFAAKQVPIGGSCGDAGAHAVVINAVHYEDGKCQVHIRNSWGSSSEDSGWYDLADFGRYAYGAHWIENR